MNKRLRAFYKILSVISGLSLVFNSILSASLIPFIITPPPAYAQEEVTPTLEATPTTEPTVAPTPDTTPTITETPTEAPTPTEEVTPSPTPEELTPTPTEVAQPTETGPPAEGQILDGASTTATQSTSQWTFEKVVLDKEYIAPQNSGVKLTFTKIPDPAGNIKIEEITLTEDQIKQTGSLSDKAYDITSDMKDGEFTYNLSLPIPESSKGKSVEVKFAEELSNIDSAEKVDNVLTKTDTSVSIASLDHFTIFVVTAPNPVNSNCSSSGLSVSVGDRCYNTIQEAIYNADEGETINVAAGTYNENQILIDKPLTLQGAGKADTIIDGGGTSTGGLVKITASSGTVTLSEFTIQNTNNSDDHGHGVYVDNAGVTVNISDNAIKNVGPVGINIHAADSVQIEGNIISALYSTSDVIPNGIQIYNESFSGMGITGTIDNNEIKDCSWVGYDAAIDDYESNTTAAGILIMDTTAALEISNNNIHNNNVGIDIEAGSPTNIENNDIHDNAYGVVLWNENPSINNNNIENNSTGGVFRTTLGSLSGTVNATNNYWGSDNPDFASITSGDVSYDPWWMDSAMTLSSTPAIPVITSVAGDNLINSSEYNQIVVTGTAEVDSLVSVTLEDDCGFSIRSEPQQLSGSETDYSIILDGSDTVNDGSNALCDGTIYTTVTAQNAIGNTSDPASSSDVILDINSPTVTVLGDGTSDYSLPYLVDGLFGAAMSFDEKLSVAGRETVEGALNAGASTTLTFKWNDNNGGDGTKLRISVSGSETATFANDVTTDVTDLAGNTTTNLLLIDSDEIDTIFDDVSSMLASQGIESNIGDVTAGNFTSFSDLYFEKSVTVGEMTTKMGRLTFTAELDLSDPDTQEFLQDLGTYMKATQGSMKFDATTATQMKEAGAEIKMYGVDSLGYIDGTTPIIVKDDEGNILSEGDTNYPTLSSISYVADDGGTITFSTNHFTQFDLPGEDQTTPDDGGNATLSDDTPQVVVTDPNQAVDIMIEEGTDNPTIDVSAFIIDGQGDIPQITINSDDPDNVDVAIPATTVTGPNDWDGVIAAPTVTTIDLPVISGETSTLGTAIEIGFATDKLSFDNAVRILLPGQGGKRAGYSRPGTDFTEITNICSADTQEAGDALGADGECKTDVGDDLVIWTKHFTKFASYTQSATSSGGGSSGGGGGGGGAGDGLSDGKSDGRSDGRSDGNSSSSLASVLGTYSFANWSTGEEVLGTEASDSALTPTPTPQSGDVLADTTAGKPWWSWIVNLFSFIIGLFHWQK